MDPVCINQRLMLVLCRVTTGSDEEDGDHHGGVCGVAASMVPDKMYKWRRYTHVRAAYSSTNTVNHGSGPGIQLRPTRLSTLEVPLPTILNLQSKSSAGLISSSTASENISSKELYDHPSTSLATKLGCSRLKYSARCCMRVGVTLSADPDHNRKLYTRHHLFVLRCMSCIP